MCTSAVCQPNKRHSRAGPARTVLQQLYLVAAVQLHSKDLQASLLPATLLLCWPACLYS